jgi:hypothetical protein
VPLEILQIFVKSLETNTKVPVTKENAGSVSLLAKEFWIEELLSECSAVQACVSVPEIITALSERISRLEDQLNELILYSTNYDRELANLQSAIKVNAGTLRIAIDSFTSKCENQNKVLATRIGAVEGISDSLSQVTGRLSHCEQYAEQIQSDCAKHGERLETAERNISDSLSQLREQLSVCEQSLKDMTLSSQSPAHRPSPVSPAKTVKELHFPLSTPKSVNGIMSYLTWKNGGNVHDKGIVTITSKSVNSDRDYARNARNALWNAADLHTAASFCSQIELGQWVQWDFHDNRIRPTYYTVRSFSLQSWVVESSLDGVNWIKIDQQIDNHTLEAEPHTGSFPVSNSSECRFIRLTQTANHWGHGTLILSTLEVFGTFIESQ